MPAACHVLEHRPTKDFSDDEDEYEENRKGEHSFAFLDGDRLAAPWFLEARPKSRICRCYPS
jgi:hypothetical protein